MGLNSNLLNQIRYTLYAPIYDWTAQILEASRKRSIASLNSTKGKTILIVGAGTGMDLNYIPKGTKITATDITRSMVNRIEKRNLKLKHELEAIQMDGQNLKFPDESFDIVILHLILSVIPDPIKTLKEAERVLKSDGQIAVYDKFVLPHKKASLIRRFFNLFTNILFSNIIRKFEDIAVETKLKVINDQKADFGGNFRIIKLSK
jgi:phosphatidylethanolamine/phosphatidyl-N-methylethanolamine N-methyltransferase